MRIWSIHPKYLDSKWLVALWRETLLAKNVLENKTKGYKNHPQLERFKNTLNPLNAINFYLSKIRKEAKRRNYNFDINKFDINSNIIQINISKWQLKYEFQHLLKKLKIRDENKFHEIKDITNIEVHPIFNIVEWDIETWEIVSK